MDPHWWNQGEAPPCSPPAAEDFSGQIFRNNCIQALGDLNPWFHFVDANADGAHDYKPQAATNYDHLSWIGAAQLSRRLDSLIATFPAASTP